MAGEKAVLFLIELFPHLIAARLKARPKDDDFRQRPKARLILDWVQPFSVGIPKPAHTIHRDCDDRDLDASCKEIPDRTTNSIYTFAGIRLIAIARPEQEPLLVVSSSLSGSTGR